MERTIWIKNKETGERKQIPLSEVDKYGVKLNLLQKLVTSKGLPLGVGIGAGSIAGLSGVGAPLAIPGAGAASGMTYALQRLLSPLAGVSEETAPEQLMGGGKEFLKGAGSEVGGRAVSWAGGKVLGPLVSKLPLGSASKVGKAVDVMKKQVGAKIDELLAPFENAPLTEKAVTKILEGLSKLGSSQTFKHNPAAVKFINGAIKLFSEGIGVGEAHAVRSDLGAQVFTKTGIEKYVGTAAKKAEQAAKQIVAPGLKEGIEEVVPGYSGLLKEYGDLSKFGQAIQKPLRMTPATIASMFATGLGGTLLGGPRAGFAASGAVTLPALIATNPYLKFLLQKVGGTALKALQYPARVGFGAGTGGILGGYEGGQ